GRAPRRPPLVGRRLLVRDARRRVAGGDGAIFSEHRLVARAARRVRPPARLSVGLRPDVLGGDDRRVAVGCARPPGHPVNAPEPGRAAGAADAARGLARSVLYESYVLWPYRRSAPKNQRRWTFGGVHPRAWSEADHADDPWRLDVECLVELPHLGGPPALEVGLRFLQVV